MTQTLEPGRRSGLKETARLEAFSDGVFAFAITLLVLYLKDPLQGGGPQVSLFQGLINQWPSFFGFVTSFMTILIMWVGHHEMFDYIVQVDRRFMFLNGFLLFFVTLTPFTTSLVSNHILSSDSNTAAVVYAGSFLLLAISWNTLMLYSSRNRKLLSEKLTDEHLKKMKRDYLVGPVFYGIALLVAFFSGIASVALILAVAVFFAVGTRSPA
ncbi:MAG TPA: TMEM175 family protein [Nitrososphaerales archaeon]